MSPEDGRTAELRRWNELAELEMRKDEEGNMKLALVKMLVALLHIPSFAVADILVPTMTALVQKPPPAIGDSMQVHFDALLTDTSLLVSVELSEMRHTIQ